MNERQTRNKTLKKNTEQKMPVRQLPNKGAETAAEPGTEFSGLEPEDFEALRRYDPSTGHLLKYDVETGAMDSSSIRILNEKGLLQRLLAHGLIFSGGNLTSKGLRLCKELANRDWTETPNIQIQKDPSVKIIFPNRGGPRDKTSVNASITRFKTQGLDESLITLLSPQSYEAERFRMLKTCILYPPSGKPPRSILITSVGQGDGKSFVAANLAISIAQNLSSPVLLIDCDLRKPSIHHLFGFGNVPGLTEYLCETGAFQSLLQETNVDRLYILPAGSTPKNPSELLSSPRMASLVKELTVRYRDLLVLLDSPPVTITAEPSVLAKLVSGILMVVKYGRTRRSDLQMVMDKLGKEKFLGSVLNCYEHSLREYYGYRKYPGYAGTPGVETASAP
jgi:capsular exopolysaccharide synthesis family protein